VTGGELPAAVAELAAELAGLHGVVAVVLGGSRAAGTHRPDSDWDLGLYYRGAFEPGLLRHRGEASALGEWGPVMNGGAWLTVDGRAVDVIFRDLQRVERWIEEAEQGRFEILTQNGYLAGAPTYLPVGELATCRHLHGVLPRPEFPDALAQAAPQRWRGKASVALMFAGTHAGGGDVTAATGMLALAALCAAHARMAERREWVHNEKRLLERAGLQSVGEAVAAADVDAVGTLIGIEPLTTR
jgi:predicted nucleotidyltransferase